MTPLPRLLVVTDAAQAARTGRDLRDVLVRATEAGALGVVVRDRHLPPEERRDLVYWVQALLAETGGVLVVASPPVEPGQNVHLTAAEPPPDVRPPIMGRSCHDLAELQAAADEGCDYATLSPVFLTPSKPRYGPALGLDALHRPPLPVYALGGVTTGNAADCRAAGAVGVAVMGAVMRAADPARTVSDLLATIEGTR